MASAHLKQFYRQDRPFRRTQLGGHLEDRRNAHALQGQSRREGNH